MFAINAGDFRHKITLLRPTIAKNEDNIPVKNLKSYLLPKPR